MLEFFLLLVVLLRTNHLWLTTTPAPTKGNTRRRVKMVQVVIKRDGRWVVAEVGTSAIPFLQRRGVLLPESLMSQDSMTLLSMANYANMR